MNPIIIGIFLQIIGAFILLLVANYGCWHRKNFETKWWKRYDWSGWRPLLRISPPNKKPYWRIKLKYKSSRSGAIPPKHQWNLVAFAYILSGAILQLKFL